PRGAPPGQGQRHRAHQHLHRPAGPQPGQPRDARARAAHRRRSCVPARRQRTRARAGQGRGAGLCRFRPAVVRSGGAAGPRAARGRAPPAPRRRGARETVAARSSPLGIHGNEGSMRAWNVVDLGTEGFRETWARQLALVDQRQRGEASDTLLLVEHPHVFTLGRRREAEANVLMPGDVEVIGIDRGGDVTYHGPGPIVAYPIVLLHEGERDLHRFLRNLEEAVITTCSRFGLVADREAGKTGVWLTTPTGMQRKLCSLGIACRRWVTFHGLALNVTSD